MKALFGSCSFSGTVNFMLLDQQCDDRWVNPKTVESASRYWITDSISSDMGKAEDFYVAVQWLEDESDCPVVKMDDSESSGYSSEGPWEDGDCSDLRAYDGNWMIRACVR